MEIEMERETCGIERTGDILRLCMAGEKFPTVRTCYAKADLAIVEKAMEEAGFWVCSRNDAYGHCVIVSLNETDRLPATFYNPLTWDEVASWAVWKVGYSVGREIISVEKAHEILGKMSVIMEAVV